MKRRLTVQLPEQVLERLEAAAERPDTSKSAIVEAALDQFLSTDADDDTAPPRRIPTRITLQQPLLTSSQNHPLPRGRAAALDAFQKKAIIALADAIPPIEAGYPAARLGLPLPMWRDVPR